MILALVTGALFRAAEQRTSKAGKSYVTATIISKDGDASTFVNMVAFSDSAKDAILALGAGDTLSAQGKATIGVYEKNGEHRPSLSIVADHVLALRQPREAVQSKERTAKPTPRREWRPGDGPDDQIPFGDSL
jgi:Single-strand binding protein family